MTQHEIITRKMTAGIATRGRKMMELEAKKLARLTKQQQQAANRAARLAAWHAYRDEVRRLTELQPLDQVRGIELRGASHHLDHVVSIRAAWLAGWPAEQCASLDNLQMLPWQENFRKGNGCYCALDISSRITPN